MKYKEELNPKQIVGLRKRKIPPLMLLLVRGVGQPRGACGTSSFGGSRWEGQERVEGRRGEGTGIPEDSSDITAGAFPRMRPCRAGLREHKEFVKSAALFTRKSAASFTLVWLHQNTSFFFFFFLSMVALQCCASFLCTAKRISCTHAHIPSFLDPVPIEVTMEH